MSTFGPHPSHETRFSDASTFDEICVNCGATDEVPGGWGQLAYPYPKPRCRFIFSITIDGTAKRCSLPLNHLGDHEWRSE